MKRNLALWAALMIAAALLVVLVHTVDVHGFLRRLHGEAALR